MTRVAYVTAGTTGAGHQVRGLALRRGLERAGFKGEFSLLGPAHAFAGLPQPDVPITVPPEAFRNIRTAAASDLAETLRALEPDLLLVDLFWLPIQQILATLPIPGWLLTRAASPWFLAGPKGIPFYPPAFARRIAIEPFPLPFAAEYCDPIVVTNPDEHAPPGELRRLLGTAEHAPLRIIAHGGMPGEVATLQAYAEKGCVGPWQVLDLRTDGALFPAARLLGQADTVALGGGYNSVWEAHWMGYRARAILHPFARPIDDQEWRVRASAAHVFKENGADTIARWITSA